MTDAVDPRTRPFRFGVGTAAGTPWIRANWAEHARRVESLGFSTLQVADHYLNSTVCTPRLAAAAAATTTLRVGSYVYANDFRHPLLLAREAAEIDLISGGRMELGIGAGWAKDEYDRIGMSFDPGAVRAARFEESVGLVRRLHLGETVTLDGRFYRLDGASLMVDPVQRPIPLLLGGGGPRMTRFAARTADVVAFVPRSLPGGGLDPAEFASTAFESKLALVDEEAARRPDGGPERAVLLFHTVRSLSELPSDPDRSWSSSETLADSPYVLAGDTSWMVDTLQERRERWGISYWTCFETDLELMVDVVARLAGT